MAVTIPAEISEKLAELTQAIEANPDDSSAYFDRGNTYFQAGDYERAIADYTQVVGLVPGDISAFTNRGAAHYMLWNLTGDPAYLDRALADFSQALALDRNYLTARAYRCTAYAIQQQYETALTDCNQAVELLENTGGDYTFTYVYIVRSYVYTGLNRPDEAAQDLATAREYNPDGLDAWWGMADAYFDLHLYPEALAAYREYLARVDGASLTPVQQQVINWLETVVTLGLTPTPAPALPEVTGKIAFSSNRDGDYEIYVVEAKGSDIVQITRNNYDDFSPKWSPDGTQLLFISRLEADTEVMVMNADGSNERQLTFNESNEFTPAWSPDGRQIVFQTLEETGSNLYVMNTDGSVIVQLTRASASNRAPNWSPDGTRIVFTSNRDGDEDLYLMDADGTNERQLTFNNSADFTPAWSPDGRRIVYGTEGSLMVIEPDNPTPVTLVTGFRNPGSPAWSADGRSIAFTAFGDTGNTADIYIMGADGSNPVRVLRVEGGISSIAWQPASPS